jgi:hypothetical protein
VRQSWISFEAVEISFLDKSPDSLKTKEQSGKSDFQPAFQVFANRLILSETPFSGQRDDSSHNILWLQENFARKLQRRYSQIKSMGFPRQH